MSLRVSGYYRLEVHQVDGSIRPLSSWFENTILDTGLDRIGGSSSSLLTYCQIGAGTTPPTTSDTHLEAPLASTTTVDSTFRGVHSPTAFPFYDDFTAYWRRTFSFPVGAAVGRITEVGVGWESDGSLYSRSLVKDIEGNPTTVVVLADEVLKVVYEAQITAWPDDVTGYMNFNRRDFVYRLRMCNADYGSTSTGTLGWVYPSESGFHMGQIGSYFWAYDGGLGDYYGGPLGSNQAISGGQSNLTYVEGSYERTHRFVLDYDEANFDNGIAAISCIIGPASWQIGFDPPIPKTEYHQMVFDITIKWTRPDRPEFTVTASADSWLEGYDVTIETSANAVIV